jgi:hypothetical protein
LKGKPIDKKKWIKTWKKEPPDKEGDTFRKLAIKSINPYWIQPRATREKYLWTEEYFINDVFEYLAKIVKNVKPEYVFLWITESEWCKNLDFDWRIEKEVRSYLAKKVAKKRKKCGVEWFGRTTLWRRIYGNREQLKEVMMNLIRAHSDYDMFEEDLSDCATYIWWKMKKKNEKWKTISDECMQQVKEVEEDILQSIHLWSKVFNQGTDGNEENIHVIDGNKIAAEWYWKFFFKRMNKFRKPMEQNTMFEELRNALIIEKVTIFTPVMKETIIQAIDSETDAKEIIFDADIVKYSIKISTFSSEAELHPLLNDFGKVISGSKEVETSLFHNLEISQQHDNVESIYNLEKVKHDETVTRKSIEPVCLVYLHY